MHAQEFETTCVFSGRMVGVSPEPKSSFYQSLGVGISDGVAKSKHCLSNIKLLSTTIMQKKSL